MAKSMIVATLLFNGLPALSGQIREKAGQVVRKIALDVAAGAKVRTPPRVDTGGMMGGFMAEAEEDGDELRYVVWNTQEYHIYQELGTRHMSAHPMLIPAADENREPFKRAMQKVAG